MILHGSTRRALTHKVKCTYSPRSTPVVLNCLTLWEHSSLGLFETQEPPRYLKHRFVLKPRQTASSSPGFKREDVSLQTPVHTVNARGRGERGESVQAGEPGSPECAFPLTLRNNKIRLQPMNVPSLRKGSLEIAPKIKEGIYPHDCSAEKAIYIVC